MTAAPEQAGVELAARRIRRMFSRLQAAQTRAAHGEVSRHALQQARQRVDAELLQLLRELAARP